MKEEKKKRMVSSDVIISNWSHIGNNKNKTNKCLRVFCIYFSNWIKQFWSFYYRSNHYHKSILNIKDTKYEQETNDKSFVYLCLLATSQYLNLNHSYSCSIKREWNKNCIAIDGVPFIGQTHEFGRLNVLLQMLKHLRNLTFVLAMEQNNSRWNADILHPCGLYPITYIHTHNIYRFLHCECNVQIK